MIIDISMIEAVVVPMIIFALTVLKRSGMPSKYLPTASLIVGVGWCMYIMGPTMDSFLTGIIIGSIAVGVHSGTKNSAEAYLFGTKKKEEQ